jgi:hypothetical protein
LIAGEREYDKYFAQQMRNLGEAERMQMAKAKEEARKR